MNLGRKHLFNVFGHVGKRQKFDGIKKLEILDDRVYFPRHRHAAMLRPLLSSEPNGIIPVVGVPNVGKTTIIRKVLEGRLVAHIDFRKQGVIHDINQFIRILQDQFQFWSSSSRELSDSVNKLIGGSKMFGFEFQNNSQKLDLVDFCKTMNTITSLLMKIKEQIHFDELHVSHSRRIPVIFLDDSNKLRYLLCQPDGKILLRAFFDWAVSASKTEKLVHVVVASSSGLFVRWLESEFGLLSHLRTVIIDDLSNERAHKFLFDYAEFLEARKPLNEDETPLTQLIQEDVTLALEEVEKDKREQATRIADFSRAIDTVGGCIYHLRLFCQDYVAGIPVDSIIGSILAKSRQIIYDAFRPEDVVRRDELGEVHWSKAEWRDAMVALVENGGEMEYQKLSSLVFPTNSRGLDSLVFYDRLWYRPSNGLSANASDQNHTAVIKFPSYNYFQAAKLVLKSLPDPFISVLVAVDEVRIRTRRSKKNDDRKIRVKSVTVSQNYRTVDLSPDDFHLPGLTERLAHVFGCDSPDQVRSVVLERSGIELYRNEDLRLVHSLDKLRVQIVYRNNRGSDVYESATENLVRKCVVTSRENIRIM